MGTCRPFSHQREYCNMARKEKKKKRTRGEALTTDGENRLVHDVNGGTGRQGTIAHVRTWRVAPMQGDRSDQIRARKSNRVINDIAVGSIIRQIKNGKKGN